MGLTVDSRDGAVCSHVPISAPYLIELDPLYSVSMISSSDPAIQHISATFSASPYTTLPYPPISLSFPPPIAPSNATNHRHARLISVSFESKRNVVDPYVFKISLSSSPLLSSLVLSYHFFLLLYILTHSQLIVSIRGNVPHPREGLVAGLFDDFKVPHLQTGYGEIRDLELDFYGCSPVLCVFPCAIQVSNQC